MALPKPSEIEGPLKEWLQDGKERALSEAIVYIKDYFQISENEAAEMLESGKETHLQNRIRWAKVSLQQQGLAEKTRRGHFRLRQLSSENESSDATATDIRLEETKEKALSALRAYSEELKRLMNNDTNADDDYLNEKVNRLTSRLRHSLLAIGKEEITRLDNMISNYNLNSIAGGSIHTFFNSLDAYLQALIEEIEQYPDELLLDSSSRFIEEDLSSYWQLCHSTIETVSRQKFEDGHYADSVETAFKEINHRIKVIVKQKTGQEFDGSDLMNRAFSINNPLIVLDDLLTVDGKNIQIGFMQIFSGVMTGIRNPKAHSIITISPERAMHFLLLASLLASKLDEVRS